MLRPVGGQGGVLCKCDILAKTWFSLVVREQVTLGYTFRNECTGNESTTSLTACFQKMGCVGPATWLYWEENSRQGNSRGFLMRIPK